MNRITTILKAVGRGLKFLFARNPAGGRTTDQLVCFAISGVWAAAAWLKDNQRTTYAVTMNTSCSENASANDVKWSVG